MLGKDAEDGVFQASVSNLRQFRRLYTKLQIWCVWGLNIIHIRIYNKGMDTQLHAQIISQKMGFDTSEAPIRFNHWIGNAHRQSQEKNEWVKENGLQPRKTRYSEIQELLPFRPETGIYFWAEGQHPKNFKNNQKERMITVSVDKMDTSKLFAFPAQATSLAEEIAFMTTETRMAMAEKIKEYGEALSHVKAVSYEDYNGEFLAEWIYTGEITPEMMED